MKRRGEICKREKERKTREEMREKTEAKLENEKDMKKEIS